jgi:L-histidine N-alpha-methyltransferase
MTDPDPLLDAVLRGLSAEPKTLPPTLFYDDVGSALFDRITTLDAYYPTRAEALVFDEHGPALAALVAGDADAVALIEPGCGSGGKAEKLLQHLPAVAYVGVDVSVEALIGGAGRLSLRFPGVQVVAIEADYHQPWALPELPPARKIAFFPGSTIGNFDPADAVGFLAGLREVVGPSGAAVVGVDLWKDVEVLRVAYDDPEGVTAAFNRNALRHLNRRYGATFDVDGFAHESRVDVDRRRVEMHLVARGAQDVRVAGRRFRIEAGESLHTENAYKYDLDGFSDVARQAGFRTLGWFTDPDVRFAVFALGAS